MFMRYLSIDHKSGQVRVGLTHQGNKGTVFSISFRNGSLKIPNSCRIFKSHLALVGQELSSGQSQTWSDNSLNSGVVGQVQEQAHVLHGAVLFEVLLEEPGGLHVDTHSGEHDGEVVFVVIQH